MFGPSQPAAGERFEVNGRGLSARKGVYVAMGEASTIRGDERKEIAIMRD
jgi:hypothetical protein